MAHKYTRRAPALHCEVSMRLYKKISLIITVIILSFLPVWFVLPVLCFEDMSHSSRSPQSIYDKTYDKRMDEQQFPMIHSMLEDSTPDNRIYLRGTENRGLGFLFIESLTAKLLENKPWLVQLNDQEDNFGKHGSAERYAIYKGEVREEDYIRRDIVVQVLSSAVAETVEQTPFGVKFKQMGELIANYFKIEYSKDVSGEAGLYLPGQVSEKGNGKEYKIKLFTDFYADSDTLKGNFSVSLYTEYHDMLANSTYDAGDQELSIEISNRDLNEYLGMKLELDYINKPDERSGLLKVSLGF